MSRWRCSGWVPFACALAALLSFAGAARADDLTLVLHDPVGRQAPVDKCDVALCTTLLGLIEGAKTSIDMAFYGFRNQSDLLAALEAAKKRGVVVRGVVDMDANDVNYYSSTTQWMAALTGFHTDHKVDVASQAAAAGRYAGIQYKCDPPPGFAGPLQCLAIDLGGGKCYLSAHASREPIHFEGDIMHDKFAIVDGRYVWTGSTNASDSCTGGYNANLVMVVDSPTVARWYTAEFEQMYTGGKYHNTKDAQSPMRASLGPDLSVEVMFSPQHEPMHNGVVPLIKQARASIDIAVFYLTHKEVTQELINAHNRGVKVRVMLDATGASNEYSKHDVLRLAGIPLKVDDFGGKLHAKTALIDGEILIGGSMNWTSAGEDGNDENTIIVRSKHLGAQYAAWYTKLWSELDDRWLQGRPDPESKDSGRACYDGVDNDHDSLVDAKDPGCSAHPPEVSQDFPYRIVAMDGAKCSWDLLAGEVAARSSSPPAPAPAQTPPKPGPVPKPDPATHPDDY